MGERGLEGDGWVLMSWSWGWVDWLGGLDRSLSFVWGLVSECQ